MEMHIIKGTFKPGTRVAIHPACDEGMQGDRYGTVVGFGLARIYIDRETGEKSSSTPIRVKLDQSGRTRRLHHSHITVED
jgi:hypothetical protein